MWGPITSEEAAPDRRPASSRLYPWYDSVWLDRYERAKAIIRTVRPADLPSFVNALRVLQTPQGFRERLIEQPIDDATLVEIRRIRMSLRPTELELHEARRFGRFVVHNHPYFAELQERLTPLVSGAVGEPVEGSYNFLSIYTAMGVCRVHLDAPSAKWTLDLCIDQSTPWPIYFSQVQPWPRTGRRFVGGRKLGGKPEAIARGAVHSSHLTTGTGDRLFRQQPMALPGSHPSEGGPQFCTLLFFHFIPLGTAELVSPKNWARLFGIPELGVLSGY